MLSENGHENRRGSEGHAEVDYKRLFSIRYVETAEKRGFWSFTVSDNYTIFITAKPHGHSYIAHTQGIENDETLVEGYINFSATGKVRSVEIKALHARGTLIQQSREKQEKISQAIRDVIKNELNKV